MYELVINSESNKHARRKNKDLFIIFLYISLYYIQSDSGGICITLGNDSMSDSKQKSSYEHGSDFLIPVHALM